MNAWPGRVHHRVGDLEARLVDADEDFEADAGPRLRTRLLPLVVRPADRGEQAVDVGLRIGDAERDAERRALAADVADGRWLRQRKALAEQRVERGLARFRRAFAVDLGTRRLGKRAPVAALVDRLHRALEQRAMAFEKGMRHVRELQSRLTPYYRLSMGSDPIPNVTRIVPGLVMGSDPISAGARVVEGDHDLVGHRVALAREDEPALRPRSPRARS